MMKKCILLMFLGALIPVCCNAQFKLTPSAGLMTEDGPYTILRFGTETENYEAAKHAVESAIPEVDVGEIEYGKSFSATAKYKNHSKLLPGHLRATDWEIDYTLKVDVTEEKIIVSFSEVGSLVAWVKEGFGIQYHPTIGQNSWVYAITDGGYLFNSKGQISKGHKRLVELYENIANEIIKDIEKNL
jgi:hypothetical protein